jgi:hypothetical protein
VRAWLGVIAAAVLLLGCGTAMAATPASGASPAKAQASGSARAQALANHLVAEMTFPRGTKPVPLLTIPSALRNPSPAPGLPWASASRLLVAPVDPAAVWAVLLPHKPFDSGGQMGTAGSNGPVGSSAVLPAPEPGVTAAEAAVWLEPWHHGTTLIAAYGYATWLPVRTAAEYLNPASFRAVTVAATSSIDPHQRLVTRTFTSLSVIARIATFLNSRPAAPELDLPCPLPVTTYQATFLPAGKADPNVIAAPFCLTDQITVNGVDQPLVWDTNDGLGALMASLLGEKFGSLSRASATVGAAPESLFIRGRLKEN